MIIIKYFGITNTWESFSVFENKEVYKPNMKKQINLFLVALLVLLTGCSHHDEEYQEPVIAPEHNFSFDDNDFLLDGKPFQIISGEIHYSRIPREYWRHRIQMVKAMGCNTVATYVFWNHHEKSQGDFDFTTGTRDIAEFLQIARDEGMWVLFRPGPYSCGEWDLGGIPPYLLSIPDIKLRCMDERYMEAVSRYIGEISEIIKPFLITRNGPILMVQIENEYGSYGNDRNYMEKLREIWLENGIDVPFYTSDGATPHMLEAGSLPGCAVGLDPCSNIKGYNLAREMNPGVPVFSSETYPGWLTHWGEEWARPDPKNLYEQVRFLMENRISVNFYMLHGGTNFGFTAGANSGGNGYQPDLTSYDYDAPINEQGRPTEKYFALRELLGAYRSGDTVLPAVPDPIPVIEIPSINMNAYSSVWDNLPDPVPSVQPKPFESYGLYEGFALYRTKLTGRKSGTLKITDLHDYATIFMDGEYVGKIDRREGQNSLEIPSAQSDYPVLEILVEGMGRINFAQELIDRKGITERVSLSGMTLMNWDVFLLPMDSAYIEGLAEVSRGPAKPGIFFKGVFELREKADTYLDMTEYTKGIVWVNGNNLGRYWNIGPQHSLYCPASFLRIGRNEIVVLDLHQIEGTEINGISELM